VPEFPEPTSLKSKSLKSKFSGSFGHPLAVHRNPLWNRGRHKIGTSKSEAGFPPPPSKTCFQKSTVTRHEHLDFALIGSLKHLRCGRRTSQLYDSLGRTRGSPSSVPPMGHDVLRMGHLPPANWPYTQFHTPNAGARGVHSDPGFIEGVL